MDLFRLRLRPITPWVTPWQADTLMGLLCWMLARREGASELQTGVLEPALRGSPPFVLSDAFPGDFFPLPAILRSGSWSPDVRKAIAHSGWIHREVFLDLLLGREVDAARLLAGAEDSIFIRDVLHNTISRDSGTVGAGGNLFSLREMTLRPDIDTLTVYARVRADWQDRLLTLFRELSTRGFGADASTGRGEFEIAGGLEHADDLEVAGATSDGVFVLSTFQPAANDSTDGVWECFTKYGKLGPDFGLENVFKRPILMMRPGAYLRCEPRDFVGRAIPANELLSQETLAELASAHTHPVHMAFGLAVSSRAGATPP